MFFLSYYISSLYTHNRHRLTRSWIEVLKAFFFFLDLRDQSESCVLQQQSRLPRHAYIIIVTIYGVFVILATN